MGKDDKPRLGGYLKSLRDAKGLSLREVEEKAGVSNAFLSQLESGKVKQPSPVILYKLAELYAVPYALLLERAGHPVPEASAPSSHSGGPVFHRLGGVTEEEEEALLAYLAFLRSQAKRGARKK
jgi:transcriptional regulator with XRE-family HTH domain